MIKIENANVCGWETAIRGMRNPMDSWNKSDSNYLDVVHCTDRKEEELAYICGGFAPIIGQNDHELMMKLAKAGSDHRKFMRMIVVSADITAPFYWWKEYSTYKVGTVANSCSTMHRLTAKQFELRDFSTDHLFKPSIRELKRTINTLNDYRDIYLNGGTIDNRVFEPKDKDVWWQMIQTLPSSYNQRRTVMLNYEVLTNIYHARKNHKLDEWRTLCEWIETLPQSELITGQEAQHDCIQP